MCNLYATFPTSYATPYFLKHIPQKSPDLTPEDIKLNPQIHLAIYKDRLVILAPYEARSTVHCIVWKIPGFSCIAF